MKATTETINGEPREVWLADEGKVFRRLSDGLDMGARIVPGREWVPPVWGEPVEGAEPAEPGAEATPLVDGYWLPDIPENYEQVDAPPEITEEETEDENYNG